MDPLTVGLIVYSVGSTLLNIWQGIENWKLKKKIAVLNQVIQVLGGKIEDLQKELKAQRWWNIRMKAKLTKEMRELEKAVVELQGVVENKDESAMDEIIDQLRESA